ncbi:uncharacterized protein DUF5051 [Agrobacterium vitis]|nr:uncharacterized protein DUF5051 [Agrobacterium vitis]
MNDIMIDIEKLGTRPGSVIASIGAVEFDQITGKFGRELYVVVDMVSAEKAGLTIDASTVLWWMQKTAEARESTFAEGYNINTCLWELSHFVTNIAPNRVWAHGPAFDLVLLESAYRVTQLICPWNYKQMRDTRTLLDIAGVEIEPFGTHHNALDDAKAQALAVIEAMKALRQTRETALEDAACAAEERDQETGTYVWPDGADIAETIRELKLEPKP